MKVVNSTAYDTRAIRSLCLVAYNYIVPKRYRATYVIGVREWEKFVVIRVQYGRTRMVTTVLDEQNLWTLRLPRPEVSPAVVAKILTKQVEGWGPVPSVDVLARLLNLVHHSVWSGWVIGDRGVRFMAQQLMARYALPLHVYVRPQKVPTKVDPKVARYTKVLELERRWVTKHKLATTKLKALRTKRKYYERQGITLQPGA